MKLFISIFLILSHLFSTVGFSMEVHECAGKKSYTFDGISFTRLCKCEHDSEKHSKDCCSDKKTIVKAEQKDKMTQKVVIAKNIIEPFIFQQAFHFSKRDIIHSEKKSLAFGSEYPPDHSPPLYILYNVFLI